MIVPGVVLGDINNGLLAYYPFNGTTSDFGGNIVPNSATGITPTSDRFGNVNAAFTFSSGSKLSLDSLKDYLSTGVTVSFTVWFQTNALPSSPWGNTIFSADNIYGSRSFAWMLVSTTSGGKIYLEYGPGGSSMQKTSAGSGVN